MAAQGTSVASPGSKGQRNLGELQYKAGVSDMSPSASGIGVIGVGLHPVTSMILILLICTCAISEEALLRLKNL